MRLASLWNEPVLILRSRILRADSLRPRILPLATRLSPERLQVMGARGETAAVVLIDFWTSSTVSLLKGEEVRGLAVRMEVMSVDSSGFCWRTRRASLVSALTRFLKLPIIPKV